MSPFAARTGRLRTVLTLLLLLATGAAAGQGTPADGPMAGLPDRAPAKGLEQPLSSGQPTVIRAGILHTQARDATGAWAPPISDGIVVIRDRRIAAVGPAGSVIIPDGARVIEAPVVTPGLIDGRSVVGLAGWLNYGHDQDQLEDSEPIQPELQATDAFNGREPLLEWIRSFGVTTDHTGHAPGNLISGQTMIVKTRTGELEDAVVTPLFAIAATLGDDAMESDRSPGTRAKQLAMLRQALLDAREHADQLRRAGDDPEKRPGRDLRKEALGRVLSGEVPLLLNCHRSIDIQNALRLSDEFGFRLILDGAAEVLEHADEVKARGIPVLAHPPMMRATGQGENASMTTVARLIAVGSPCALQSGYEGYVPKTRVVLLEAAIACAYGASFADALGTITLSAAEILGISARVGSIEVGKDADIALYDGDPFEYTSHCIGVLIEGQVVSAIVR